MSRPILNVYIDESSQTKHRYLVLGGICVPEEHPSEIELSIRQVRLPELPHGELKWTKISKGKFQPYQRVVELFFEYREKLMIFDFHSAVIDTHLRNERAFNQGSREIGFNKEIYQLAMKFVRLYPQFNYHIYPDKRSTTSSTEELREILNSGIRKQFSRTDWPVRRVHFRQSEDESCLQLADLFAGCVAFLNNGHHLAEGASPAKIEIAKLILARAGINSASVDTAKSGKFTIWHRQLRKAV